jgi:hypothetical protein
MLHHLEEPLKVMQLVLHLNYTLLMLSNTQSAVVMDAMPRTSTSSFTARVVLNLCTDLGI